MNKKLSICITVLCIAALLSVPVHATDINPTNNNELPTEQTTTLNSLTNKNIKKVIPNEVAKAQVQEIMNEDTVDTAFVEKISKEGSVEVEPIADQNIAITVDIDEPTNTIIYDNGIKVEEREKIGLIVENNSELPTEEYVNEIKETVETSEQNSIDATVSNFNLIDPAYAYDEYIHQVTTTGPTSKIKLRKRIVYHYTERGGGAPGQNWYKVLRSSSYIVSTKYKLKSLKMSTTYNGFASSSLTGKGMTVHKGSKNGSTISSPETKKYYKLSSPISKWFNEYYGFQYNTTTVFKYVKNGTTKTSTYKITLSR